MIQNGKICLVDSNDTQDNILANSNELSFRKKIFEQALEVLNDREKEIISLRKLKDKPVKLEELSKKFNISRERVRQIEEKAFEKLTKASFSYYPINYFYL